jgi:hypothetical protein
MAGVVSAIFGGGAKTPTYTPVAPAAMPTPATQADPSIAAAASAQRASAAGGLASTIKTSAAGAQPAQTGFKSLLGQ